MAIGTVAGIGLGLAGVGSIIGGSSSKKAANKAAQATQQAADQAAQVQRDIYGQNQQTLNPYINTGNAAMGQINALLGISPVSTPTPSQPAQYGGNERPLSGGAGFSNLAERWLSTRAQQNANPLPATTATPAVTQPSAEDAFARYRDSTGYQFRVGEGMDAVNSGFAGSGTLQSGAALRALDDYRQGMASQEFGNYLNALGNQQALGLSGASALAGVGQNYANSLGNIYQTQGSNQANAALAKAQNNPFSNVLGLLGGGLYGLGS